MVGIGPVDFSSPSTRFYGYADVIGQNYGGNYSTIRYTAQCYNGPSGSTSSNFGGAGGQSVGSDAYGQNVYHSGNPFLPSGYGQNQLRWSDIADGNIGHDGNGYLGPISIRMGIAYGSINANYWADLGVARIPKPPQAPNAPTVTGISTVDATFNWNLPDNMGAGLDSMLLRIYNDAALTVYTDYANGGSVTSRTLSGVLSPGTTYYAAVYAHNSQGYSARSGVTTFTMLPASPPTFTLMPSISGTANTITLSPPGGSPTKYTIERRVFGTTTPVTSVDSVSNVYVTTGLVPGVSYEYRASAWYGTYQSPWSSWSASIQPNPNTSPGTYFDGSSTDTPALDYGWAGTAGNSQSTATGRIPVGWTSFAASVGVSGGTGAVFQSSGGKSGAWSARAIFFTDATAAGFLLGQSISSGAYSEVDEGGTYYGSIWVAPSRSQRLQARVDWYTAADVFISSVLGAAAVVAASPMGPGATRLVASGTAPAGAERARVVAVDVTGTGWSTWKGGDYLDADAAMVTLRSLYDYFDGYTPDTALYTYEFTGAAGASTSRRFTNAGLAVDPLLDPDCPPLPRPPAAPTIEDECIVEVGTWRRYYASIPANFVTKWLAMLPTITITTGGVDARQVRVRIYENPTGAPAELVDPNTWVSEQVISYMPPNTAIELDSIDQRAWASVSGAPQIPADKLVYGSNGGPASWPILGCGIGYVLSFDVPTDAPVGNVSVGVDLTRRI